MLARADRSSLTIDTIFEIQIEQMTVFDRYLFQLNALVLKPCYLNVP